MKLSILTSLLLLALCANPRSESNSNCDEDVFLEENGVVIIEAEDIELSEGWELQNDVPGYSGQGYITWVHNTTIEKNNQGLLVYPIYVENAGTYIVKLRNYHACEDFTECNDVFIKMNNEDWQKNFNHTLAEWDWNSRQDINHVFSDASYELEAGRNMLFLSGRSQDFSIDKIAIFREDIAEEVYQNAEVTKCISE